MAQSIAPDDETAWTRWRQAWNLLPSVTYLNHGSFGPSPRAVLDIQRDWISRLESNPMEFFVRQFEPAYASAAVRMAQFVGADPQDLVLLENATAGMNVVANSFPLAPGDEIVLSNHEYGAVRRVWQRACAQRGASLRSVNLTFPPATADTVVDEFLAAITHRTRLVVVSHITSPTALILPVEKICAELRRRSIAVCIDGPHAIASLPLDLNALECDFYTASCHKWLSAPFGSGFLYVARQWHDHVQPNELSWGHTDGATAQSWRDEFIWRGTRDPSAFLAIPAAIEFLEQVGLDTFRERSHYLAAHGGKLIEKTLGRPPLIDVDTWHGPMVLTELPPGEARPLREALAARHRVEVPVIEFDQRRFLRISCHLYNSVDDLESLAIALKKLIA